MTMQRKRRNLVTDFQSISLSSDAVKEESIEKDGMADAAQERSVSARKIRDWHEKVTLVMAGLVEVSPEEKKKIKEWYENVGSTLAWNRWMKNLELARAIYRQAVETSADMGEGEDGGFEEDFSQYSLEELKAIAKKEGVELEMDEV